MADKKYSVDDILRIFSKLEKKIEDLACFVKECCAKIPVNVGTGIGLFKKFNQNKWEFKSLIAGDNVVITEQSNTITINSTAEPFTCQDVDTCLGISELGSPTKFLNEQGDFTSVGGSEFTCSSLNSCSTTNLPEGSNLYFLDERAQDAVGNILTNSPQITFTYNDGVPSISAAFASNNISQFTNDSGYVTCTGVTNCVSGTQTQIAYFHPTTGKITSDSYFTRIANGETTIIGDIFGQDGGYIKLNPTGNSYFGVYVSGTLTNNFWVNAGNLGWDWNGTSFTLPINDGNPNYVMITDGSGVLSFVDVNTIVTPITSGNLTESTSSILTITGGTGAVLGSGTSIQVKQASGSQDGYLSSTDWTTFNNKQAALGFTPEDVANKSTTTTLGTSNTLYPTQNAVKTYVDTELNPLTDKNQYIDVVDEFIGYNNALVSGSAGRVDTALHSVIKPAGVDLTKVSDTNKVCVLRFRTTSNTQINSYILSSGWNLGQGAFSMEFVHSISALATVAKDYVMVMGFANSVTNAGITNGVYFLYNRSSYGATIQCVTISGGVSTVQAASNISASTWYKYKIEVNADGTSVNFYIDGVLQQTITTNIPTATTLNGFYGQQITSSSFNVAGFDLDYVWYKYNLTTPR